ncbi:hypothetical protein [Staphylococcus epidermidis]|nr:hypothetical protein [Staphylococcus epidermidis]
MKKMNEQSKGGWKMTDEMVQFWFDYMIKLGIHERILKSREESK